MAVAATIDAQTPQKESMFLENKRALGLAAAPIDSIRADNDDLRAENNEKRNPVWEDSVTRERDMSGYYRVPDARAQNGNDDENTEEGKEKKRNREIANEMHQISQTPEKGILAQAADFASERWDAFKQSIGETFNNIRQSVGNGIQYVGEKAGQLKDFTVEKTGQAVEFAKNTTSNVIGGIKDGASNMMGGVKSFFARGADKDEPQLAKAESVNPNALLNATEKTAPTPVEKNVITLPFSPGNVFGRAASLIGITPDAEPAPKPEFKNTLNFNLG